MLPFVGAMGPAAQPSTTPSGKTWYNGLVLTSLQPHIKPI